MEPTQKPLETQASWALARQFERRSSQCGRAALHMRGTDRFTALALASTYALAARDAALRMGHAR